MTKSGNKIAMGWYVWIDYLTAVASWLFFYFYRSNVLDDKGAYPISTKSWLLIIIFVPVRWLTL